MKAALLTAPKTIEIGEIEKPALQPNEILVKLAFCGICTLEQRLYAGDMKIYYPIVMGHEASGRIVETGSAVLNDYAPGTPVALDLVTRCGECYYCRTGKSNMCLNRFKKGQRVLGGFGEYIAVKAQQVYKVPEGVSLEESAFTEPIACCIRSLKRINLSLGEDLLIIGAGPMGIMHLQVANAMGARVFISDPNKNRRDAALSLGAYKAFDSAQDVPALIKAETEGRGADCVVVTTNAKPALEACFASLSKTGRVNIYTSYSDKPPFPMDANTLHREEFLITGTEGRTEQDFNTALRLLAFKKVEVKSLISKIVSYSNIAEGIEEAMSAKTFRVLLAHEA